jgi:hypothetical protein
MEQPKNETETNAGNRRWPAAFRRLIQRISHRYRPERHYMRGGKTAGAVSRRKSREPPVRH